MGEFDKDGKTGWLDVCIYLPSLRGWKPRWVFTCLPKSAFLEEVSPDDIQAYAIVSRPWIWPPKMTELQRRIMRARGKELIDLVEENIDSILPIIEFDNSYFNVDGFTEQNLIDFTYMWLEEFYPELAKREIVIMKEDRHPGK
jgi:hypothetical protein